MVLLAPSPFLRSCVALYNELPSEPAVDVGPGLLQAIPHRTVAHVSQALRSRHPSASTTDFSLAALLRGCDVYHEPPPPRPEPSPEYRALMARLRADEEAREYARLTGTASPDDVEEDAFSMADLRSQITVIFNVLLSTFATAVAVWMAASGFDVPARLGMAFVTALVVCVAEVVLFAGYIRRLEEGKRMEKKRVDIPEVINSHEIHGTSSLKER